MLLHDGCPNADIDLCEFAFYRQWCCLPSSSGVISISRKGMEPHVKWMLSSMELMCSRKESFCDFWMIVKVSSTNLFPQCSGDGAVARALVSRSSMNKFATIGLMGDPIAAPSTCSYSLPGKVKYVVLRQNSSRQNMCSTVMAVLWCKSLSSSRCFFMMDIAGSRGTDVKSASTSNDTIHSTGCSWMPSRLCMKSHVILHMMC